MKSISAMILCFLIIILASAAGIGAAAEGGAAPGAVQIPKAHPRLGMNLNGPADWNTELPFVDVFRLSRKWISQRKGLAWGKGPALAFDEHGWVKSLEANCWAETPLCTIDGGHYPAGRYTVLYEGEGELDFSKVATVVSSGPGRMLIDVDSSKGGFFLKLMATKASNPIRNIRVVMPGFEEKYEKEPFHPVFLKRWRGVACFRFMDWMKTNGSKMGKWSERPRPGDATYTTKGVPLEVMIDLCNRQGADAWFCMPHLADDEYVREFARMTKERLDPRLKVTIELSNEVWNSQFEQTRHSWEMAKKLGLGDKERPWEGGGQWYSRRSVEIFKIWEEVFGGRERLVRVLAWQSGNTYWMERIILPFEDAYKQADALAIAPYVSMGVHLKSKGEGRVPGASEVEKWSVDQALDYLETKSLPKMIAAIQASKATADKYGLKLLAYEGGQHAVGVGAAQNNEALTRLFQAANAHPRMGKIYDKYLQAWTDAGGDLFCYFSSVGRWSKYGSWGVMQHYDEDPAQSPKFTAIMRWGKKCGQVLFSVPAH